MSLWSYFHRDDPSDNVNSHNSTAVHDVNRTSYNGSYSFETVKKICDLNSDYVARLGNRLSISRINLRREIDNLRMACVGAVRQTPTLKINQPYVKVNGNGRGNHGTSNDQKSHR